MAIARGTTPLNVHKVMSSDVAALRKCGVTIDSTAEAVLTSNTCHTKRIGDHAIRASLTTLLQIGLTEPQRVDAVIATATARSLSLCPPYLLRRLVESGDTRFDALHMGARPVQIDGRRYLLTLVRDRRQRKVCMRRGMSAIYPAYRLCTSPVCDETYFAPESTWVFAST